jgi:tetratricopeptide (TPR) repeat protein
MVGGAGGAEAAPASRRGGGGGASTARAALLGGGAGPSTSLGSADSSGISSGSGAPVRKAWRSCVRCGAWSVSALLVLACAFLAWNGPDVQLVLMRLARDFARHKARERVLGGGGSLVAVLSGREEPLPAALQQEQDASGESLTAEELAWYDGSEPGRPLYLSILGRVFDVSKAPEYYGVGRSYHHFVGRDATRSFCTGCSAPECLVSTLAGLDEPLKKEAHRWLELYTLHDKYRFVGLLRQDPVSLALDAARAEEKMLFGGDGAPLSPAALKERGAAKYREGALGDARVLWTAALVRTGEAAEQGAAELVEAEQLRAELLSLLAALAQKQGLLAEAVQHYQEALDVLDTVLAESARARSLLYANLLADQAAALLGRQQEPGAEADVAHALASALALLRRAADIHQRALSRESLPLLANTLLNLAMAANSIGDVPAAKQALAQILQAAELFPDAKHPMLSTILDRAAEGLQQLHSEQDQPDQPDHQQQHTEL